MKNPLFDLAQWLLLALLLLLGLPSAWSADLDYGLRPQPVADQTWVLQGHLEDFSFANGGNIVNTAFIVTKSGVVVIDSGPSRLYGQQFLAAIRQVSPQPIVQVLITHHHPDHFLGNQAFPAAALTALPETIHAIQAEGPGFNDNMYRLNGDWMKGTEVVVPSHELNQGALEIGGHRLELLALEGHTRADLAIFDHTTGVLFAGDLVFNQRLPTTPHAHVGPWLASLERLAALPIKVLVPGHGPVARDATPLEQTRAYLTWLQRTLAEGAAAGRDMTEMLASPLPPAFAGWAVAPTEYQRSVSHLYPAAEEAALEKPGGRP